MTNNDSIIEEAPTSNVISHEFDISVVVPMFNEEENVDHFYQRVTDVLKDLGKSYEIVIIDDGSTDGTLKRLRSLLEHDRNLRVVRFVRNFGQQMATAAGLQNSRGNVVILIDADLQVPPEDIPRMVDKLNEGFDIVYGVRQKRFESWIRQLGSWGMSHLLFRIIGIDLPDNMSGFVALDRRFVDYLNMYNEKNKFFSGLFAWLSYGRRTSIPVMHSERHGGRSKYSTLILVELALRFVTSFTNKPLRFALYIGIFLAIFTFLGSIAWPILDLVLHGTVHHVSTWLVLTASGFFSAIQLISIGVLGEYVGNIYKEVKDQPPYVIREILEHEKVKD